jgi:hypothetical protein
MIIDDPKIWVSGVMKPEALSEVAMDVHFAHTRFAIKNHGHVFRL